MDRNEFGRRARQVSIKDIALQAGVDSSTVSRALRNNPWIPYKTRKRIREISVELGYVPNETARALVRGYSRTIGACLPALVDPILAEEVLGLDQAARTYGLRLLIGLCHGGRHREAEWIQEFRERRVAGIVVFRSDAWRDHDESDSTGVSPVVTVAPYSRRRPRLSGRGALEVLLEPARAQQVSEE